MINNRRRMMSFVLSLVFIASFQACSSFPFKPVKPEEELRNRVMIMMDAKIKNDWGTVYDCIVIPEPDAISKENFIKISRPYNFTKYTINSIEINPSADEATVTVKYDEVLQGFDVKDRVQSQTWIKKEGTWYLNVPPREY